MCSIYRDGISLRQSAFFFIRLRFASYAIQFSFICRSTPAPPSGPNPMESDSNHRLTKSSKFGVTLCLKKCIIIYSTIVKLPSYTFRSKFCLCKCVSQTSYQGCPPDRLFNRGVDCSGALRK